MRTAAEWSAWYRKSKPVVTRARRAHALYKRYGWSVVQFLAQVYCQGGKCAVCRLSFDHTNGPHVDHDHETGRIRGLLCQGCNLGLGHFKDNELALLNAAKYLNAKAV